MKISKDQLRTFPDTRERIPTVEELREDRERNRTQEVLDANRERLIAAIKNANTEGRTTQDFEISNEGQNVSIEDIARALEKEFRDADPRYKVTRVSQGSDWSQNRVTW
jgi:nucleoside-diphosphate-sugar epimerase